MGAFKHLYKQKKIFNSRSTGVHLFRFFNHISGPMLADRVCSVVMEIALLAIYCLYGVVLWLRSCSSCSESKYSKTETNKNQFYQTAPCIKCETVTECGSLFVHIDTSCHLFIALSSQIMKVTHCIWKYDSCLYHMCSWNSVVIRIPSKSWRKSVETHDNCCLTKGSIYQIWVFYGPWPTTSLLAVPDRLMNSLSENNLLISCKWMQLPWLKPMFLRHVNLPAVKDVGSH